MDKAVHERVAGPPYVALSGLHLEWAVLCLSDKMHYMGVTIELKNLGDEQLCREITARIEHAFADRRGAWRVSVIGSRASETWAINVEGPNGFERSYSLGKGAGQHEPDAIRRLIVQLLPASFE